MSALGPYAPQFDVRIDDDKLPPGLRASIISVKLDSGLEGADRVEVAIANVGYQWLDHPLLEVDKPLDLLIGYAPDPLVHVFAGEITGVEPTFPSSGIPTINIAAQDRMHRLARPKKDRGMQKSIPSMGNFPLPDMLNIQTLAGQLQPDIDPVGGALSLLSMLATHLVAPQIAQKAVRVQESLSDLEFLTAIAKDNGWEMYIDHAAEPRGFALRFKSMVEDFNPDLTLSHGTSLMDFAPRRTTVGDIAGVSARVWVESLKTEFLLVLKWDDETTSFDLRVMPSQVLGISLEEILGKDVAANTVDIKPASFAMAPQKLFNELLPRLNNRLTGSASSVGDPRIQVGKVINMEGVGQAFGGLYRVTKATHTFDSGGYKTAFEVRKEAWFGQMAVPKGAEGMARTLAQRVA
ncbi:hypothetical protein DCC79_00340 [bacterium]|nr:hypothetical protein [Chloroflexi bacterium CFX6]RIL12712.1 MAG: hypothetical protein DCC79_00340 [bacterium]